MLLIEVVVVMVVVLQQNLLKIRNRYRLRLVYKMVSKPRPPLCVCRYYVCIYYSSLSKDNCLGLTIRMYPIF